MQIQYMGDSEITEQEILDKLELDIRLRGLIEGILRVYHDAARCKSPCRAAALHFLFNCAHVISPFT